MGPAAGDPVDNGGSSSVGAPTVTAMELTLTVHLPRRRPRAVDVVVDWEGRHTAADLCAALAEHLGEPVGGLRIGGRCVDPSVLVGMPPLLHGASVAVTTESGVDRDAPPRAGVLDLVVVGGPDAGRSRALVPPGFAVGRAAVGGLVVADDALSRVHAVVRVGSSGVMVADAGSTNGVVVDGSPLGTEPRVVDTTSTIVMGSTTLRLRRAPGPGPVHGERGDGTISVRPPGGSVPVAGSLEVECPAMPPERPRARIPWVAALAPVPVAVALAAFLGPQLLAFALLGPFVLLVSAVADRWGTGRARRREREAHAAGGCRGTRAARPGAGGGVRPAAPGPPRPAHRARPRRGSPLAAVERRTDDPGAPGPR